MRRAIVSRMHIRVTRSSKRRSRRRQQSATRKIIRIPKMFQWCIKVTSGRSIVMAITMIRVRAWITFSCLSSTPLWTSKPWFRPSSRLASSWTCWDSRALAATKMLSCRVASTSSCRARTRRRCKPTRSPAWAQPSSSSHRWSKAKDWKWTSRFKTISSSHNTTAASWSRDRTSFSDNNNSASRQIFKLAAC